MKIIFILLYFLSFLNLISTTNNNIYSSALIINKPNTYIVGNITNFNWNEFTLIFQFDFGKYEDSLYKKVVLFRYEDVKNSFECDAEMILNTLNFNCYYNDIFLYAQQINYINIFIWVINYKNQIINTYFMPGQYYSIYNDGISNGYDITIDYVNNPPLLPINFCIDTSVTDPRVQCITSSTSLSINLASLNSTGTFNIGKSNNITSIYPIMFKDLYIFNKSLSNINITNLILSIINTNFNIDINYYNQYLIGHYCFNEASIYKNWNILKTDLINDPILVLTNINNDITLSRKFTYSNYNLNNYSIFLNVSSYTYFPFILLDINSKIILCSFVQNLYIVPKYPIFRIYSQYNEYVCIIDYVDPGIYPIHISFDSGRTFVNMNQNYTVLNYIPKNQINENIITPLIANNIITNTNYLYQTPIIVAFSVGFFLAILFLIADKFYPHDIMKILNKIDKIYLKPKEDQFMIDQNLEKSNEIHLGPGNLVKYRTSFIGGLTTVFAGIIIITLGCTYFIVNYTYNELITTYFSSSNGNSIPLSSSYLNITSKFVGALHTKCVIPGTLNSCDPLWIISSTIQFNNAGIVCYENIINEIEKDCAVTWFCNNCQPDSVDGLTISFSYNDYNVGYDHLEYTLAVNSYNYLNSQINGTLNNNPGNIYTTLNSPVISAMTIPSVYTYYSDPSTTGFIFDSQSIYKNNPVNIQNYNNIGYSEVLAYYFQSLNQNLNYPVISNSNNYLTSQFKITRNPTYLYVTVGYRQVILTIISNTFSLMSLGFVIAAIILNFLCKPYMRKLYYRICCCKYYKIKRDKKLENKLSSIAVVGNGKEVENVERDQNKFYVTKVEDGRVILEEKEGGDLENLTINPKYITENSTVKIIHKSKNSSLEMIMYPDGKSGYRPSITE